MFTSASAAAPAPLEKVRSSYDHMVYESLLKTVEVVLLSRLTPRVLTGLGMNEAGHKTRVSVVDRRGILACRVPGPCNVSSRCVQLNFKMPQLAKVRSDMEVWKSNLEQPLTLELQWPLPAGPSHSEAKLVRAVCYTNTRLPSPCPTPQVLVEQWSILYVPSTKNVDASAGMLSVRDLYKHLAVYLRSLYSLSRVLPAYKVSLRRVSHISRTFTPLRSRGAPPGPDS